MIKYENDISLQNLMEERKLDRFDLTKEIYLELKEIVSDKITESDAEKELVRIQSDSLAIAKKQLCLTISSICKTFFSKYSNKQLSQILGIPESRLSMVCNLKFEPFTIDYLIKILQKMSERDSVEAKKVIQRIAMVA